MKILSRRCIQKKEWSNAEIINLLNDGGKSKIIEKFNYMQCSKIAVYGLGQVCNCFLGCLKENAIEVVYGIDQNAELLYSDFCVYKPSDNLPQVDIIVITVPDTQEEIAHYLRKHSDNRVINIEKLLI